VLPKPAGQGLIGRRDARPTLSVPTVWWRSQDSPGEHGLWVVEDAAEAHFALYKGRPVGSMSRIAAFSFFGNKIMTRGEDGPRTLLDKMIRLIHTLHLAFPICARVPRQTRSLRDSCAKSRIQ